MFDQIGRNAPFVFMAICDTIVVIAALVMNKLGYIKNEWGQIASSKSAGHNLR